MSLIPLLPGISGPPLAPAAPTLTINDATNVYNLLTGTLRLRYQGWQMQSALAEGDTTLQGYGATFKFNGYQPITETFELIASSAASDLEIRQAVTAIDKLLEQARRWSANRNSFDTPGGVFLKFSTPTETTRMCLIYGGSLTMLAGNGAQPTLSFNNAQAQLTLIRHPLWMDTSTTQILAETQLSTSGGFSAMLPQEGDVPALMTMRLGTPYTQASALTKIWIGVQDIIRGDNPWFNPVLLLNNGTLQASNGATVTYVADAIDGSSVVLVDFSTGPHPELCERVSVTTTSVTLYRGVFRVLCRVKVQGGTSTTVGLQLKSGTASGGSIACTEVLADNTSWQWIDLGQVELPMMRYSPDLFSVLHVYTERFTGTGTMWLDAIVMMPAAHMVVLDNAAVLQNAYAYVGADFDDTTYAYQNDNIGGLASVPDMAASDFYFPCYPGGQIVVVAQRSTSHVATDKLNVSLTTLARWKHYRDT